MRRSKRMRYRSEGPQSYPVIDVEDTEKLPTTGCHHLWLPWLELNVPNLDKRTYCGYGAQSREDINIPGFSEPQRFCLCCEIS